MSRYARGIILMLSLFSASMILVGVSQAFWKRQFAAGETQYRSRQGKGRCCGQGDVVAVGRKHVQKECYHCLLYTSPSPRD